MINLIKKASISLVFSLLFANTSLADTYVDPLLLKFINNNAERVQKVIVLLKYDTNGVPAPARYQNADVKKYLQMLYTKSFQQAYQEIAKNPNDMRVTNQFWINNSLGMEVTPNGLRKLTQIANVEKIYANRKIVNGNPVSGALVQPTRSRAGEYPYDLKEIKIDELMKTNPEIQGRGVNVGVIDTGMDGKHPILAGKIALFYDSVANKITEPVDRDRHGTHVSGTIAGGDRNANNIAVAPEARIIGAAALDGYDRMLQSMQFMLDPDGNPNTQDAPKLISNSWNAGGAPDIELFYRAISAWEAAGILPVFSAGNSGPGPSTITTPHEHPSVLAIGATGKDSKIANFSSRGPALFHGQSIQKPDFTAPGVDIVSSVPGGKMAALSGTSMACPHAAGIAALIYQVNNKFTPQQVKEILMNTLTYVDANGESITAPKWDPAYGFGKMNALAAVKMAMTLTGRSRFQSSLENFGFNLRPQFRFSNTNYTLTDITSTYPTISANWAVVKK